MMVSSLSLTVPHRYALLRRLLREASAPEVRSAAASKAYFSESAPLSLATASSSSLILWSLLAI
jgi:hypothetical protein